LADDVVEIIAAGIVVERPCAVGKQQADHRHALRRDRAGLSQLACQPGERPGRLADPRLVERETRRSSRAAAPRASIRCHGRSRRTVSKPRSS
jgi:hypothetical protein